MLEIKVLTERGETELRPAAERLAEIVLRIGDPGDEWLTLSPVPDLPAVFAQIAHRHDERYILEFRSGNDSTLMHAEFGPTSAETVARALIGWARREDGWDAGIAWEPVALPDPPVRPELDTAALARVEEFVSARLVEGYLDLAGIARAVEDWLSGQKPRVTARQVQPVVDRLWSRRVEEQRSWTGTTDPERLTTAFAALDDAGVTAREYFACCRSCGLAEIHSAGSPDARGFVFFHTQAAEALADGHGTALYYGGFECTPEESAAIGREVVAALTEAGLDTEWDGSPDRAIHIVDMDWRKRLVG